MPVTENGSGWAGTQVRDWRETPYVSTFVAGSAGQNRALYLESGGQPIPAPINFRYVIPTETKNGGAGAICGRPDEGHPSILKKYDVELEPAEVGQPRKRPQNASDQGEAEQVEENILDGSAKSLEIRERHYQAKNDGRERREAQQDQFQNTEDSGAIQIQEMEEILLLVGVDAAEVEKVELQECIQQAADIQGAGVVE